MGVISATGASAHEWLKNGAAIGAAESVVIEGKWLLLVLSFFKTHEVCNGKLIGTVGPGAVDKTNSFEGLNPNEVNKVSCEVLSGELGGCSGSALALLTPLHLPWKTKLLLEGTKGVIDDFTGTGGGVGFSIECTLSSGSKSSIVSCEATLVLIDELKNDAAAGDVDGTITNQEWTSCNEAAKAHLYASFLIKLLSGTLTVD